MRIGMDTRNAPQCVHCLHFYVTWDKHFPRGCRAFDIKSKAYPSSVVEEESGAACRAYAKKDRQLSPPAIRGD